MVRLAPDRAKRMSEDSAANLAAPAARSARAQAARVAPVVSTSSTTSNSPRRWPEAAHDWRRDQPGGAIAAHLAWSVAANEAGRALEPDARGEGRGEKLGGVEAPSSSSRRRRRHGDDDRSARRRRGASRHRLRGDGGERQTGLKLQRRDQAPSRSLIRRGEADGTEVRAHARRRRGRLRAHARNPCTRSRRPGTVERRSRSAAAQERRQRLGVRTPVDSRGSRPGARGWCACERPTDRSARRTAQLRSDSASVEIRSDCRNRSPRVAVRRTCGDLGTTVVPRSPRKVRASGSATPYPAIQARVASGRRQPSRATRPAYGRAVTD